MDTTTTYKGIDITLKALQNNSGEWRAKAELHFLELEPQVVDAPESYANEQEAKSAALRLAAQAIDAKRTHRGKL